MSNPSDPSATDQGGRDRTPPLYWAAGALLVAYVAACTGLRDNIWDADAWEHHRVFKALTENFWNPGNPIYPTTTPSARYSPYAVFWASVCRATGLDPYRALSLAGTVNMAILVVAVPFLLKRFGEGRCALSSLIVMVSLYGGIPRTTNSYALADLPWHMVNFSASSFVWGLILLALFRGLVRAEWGSWTVPLMIALSAMTMLDHPMTGVWTQAGLFLFAVTAPRGRRVRAVLTLILIQAGTLGLCLAWPWFSFKAALTLKVPPNYAALGVQWLICTQWCVPAVVLAVLALTRRDREAVRVFLPGGYFSFFFGTLALVLPTWIPLITALSRSPMPGLIYMHMSLGILAYEVGLFRPATWPARVRTLIRGDRADVAQASGEVVLACAIAYFLVPQITEILREPHLLRPYLASATGKVDKQINVLARQRSLLRDVNRTDVVFSDDRTMWSVPSVNGRVVHSLHTELFVPFEEEQRQLKDVEAFFTLKTSDAERAEILRRYNARWLILNRVFLDQRVFDALLVEHAVVRRDDLLVLMDVPRWLAERAP